MTTQSVVEETSDAQSEPAVTPCAAPFKEAEPIEWLLVAWPEVLAAARGRLGSEAPCEFCGRRGRIVRVVSLDEWRRWLRHGFDAEA